MDTAADIARAVRQSPRALSPEKITVSSFSSPEQRVVEILYYILFYCTLSPSFCIYRYIFGLVLLTYIYFYVAFKYNVI